MNQKTLKDSWAQMKVALKQTYSTLKEEDLHYVSGKEEELYENLQKKLGKTRAEVDEVLQKVSAGIEAKH